MIPFYPLHTREPRKLSSAAAARRNKALIKGDSVTARLEATSIFSVASHQSAPSVHSRNEDNYGITRVESSSSLNSMLSTQSQYRVNLNLTAKEISLLRYTWNKMLVEEQLDTPASGLIAQLATPGSIWNMVKEKPAQVTQRQTISASSTFCSQLYLNLLSKAPELELAFPSLRHQAVSLAGTMSLAINSLENLASLDEYLIELGNRHLRILGTEPAQFELMGEALIQTFQERFGKRFTHELELLWIKFYLYLSNSLLQFGLDPILKLGNNDLAPLEVYTELIFTTDSDHFSMNTTTRRNSLDTEMLSVARAALEDDQKRLGAKPAPVAVSAKGVKSEKKKSKLGRKKGECVIM